MTDEELWATEKAIDDALEVYIPLPNRFRLKEVTATEARASTEQGKNSRDTMGTTQYSLKEDGENGRKETKPGDGRLHRGPDASGVFERVREGSREFSERIANEGLVSRKAAGNDYWAKYSAVIRIDFA